MDVLIIWLICAIAGTLIGDRKGRKLEGLALGALLGLIGLLTIALLPSKKVDA